MAEEINKKMKILQLAPRVPFPEDDGGKIGIANLTKVFKKRGGEPTLFYYYHKPEDVEKGNLGQKYANIIAYCHSTENSIPRLLKAMVFDRSVYISKHISDDVKRFFDEFLKTHEFDIIHIDHSAMGELGLYVKSLINKPIALRMHNVEWTIWQRYADSLLLLDPRHFFIQRQSDLLKKYEAQLFNKMDVNFAITKVDLNIGKLMSPNANFVIAGGGVDTKEFNPDESVLRDKFNLIHATNYNWRHNISAIKWFIDEVLSPLNQYDHRIKLNLLGKYAPDWLNKYHSNVNVLGYVNEVQSHLNSSGIYIAPLFVGGGIRIKILEAMAMGLPVVASPISAEGIDATENDGLFITNSKNKFIEKIKYLISDDVFRINAGNSARLYILNNYTWDKNAGIMYDEFLKLTKF
jgi:polysaccharide biosynthesis protein PslH